MTSNIQTTDILGLCGDTAGYSKNNDVENQRNSVLENNWAISGMEGSKPQTTDDKKPLVQDMKIQNTSWLVMPKTKMEFCYSKKGICVS